MEEEWRSMAQASLAFDTVLCVLVRTYALKASDGRGRSLKAEFKLKGKVHVYSKQNNINLKADLVTSIGELLII